MDSFGDALDALLDWTPRDVAGSLVIALVCSGLAAAVFALARRKAGDKTLLVLCVTLVACLASMALSVALLDHRQADASRPPPRPGGRPLLGFGGPPGAGLGPRGMAAQRIVDSADEDGDGKVSANEFGRFMQRAFAGGKEWVNARDLELQMLGRAAPRPDPPVGPDSPPPEPE